MAKRHGKTATADPQITQISQTKTTKVEAEGDGRGRQNSGVCR
jgi:hypothetical protein